MTRTYTNCSYTRLFKGQGQDFIHQRQGLALTVNIQGHLKVKARISYINAKDSHLLFIYKVI